MTKRVVWVSIRDDISDWLAERGFECVAAGMGSTEYEGELEVKDERKFRRELIEQLVTVAEPPTDEEIE